MEKSIIIIGPQGSGKTTLAKELASKLNNGEAVFLECHGSRVLKSPFFFSRCTKETKLVVLDELYPVVYFKKYCKSFSNPLDVNKKGEKPFTISPKFILVFQSTAFLEKLINDMGSTFFQKFDVIMLDSKYNISRLPIPSQI